MTTQAGVVSGSLEERLSKAVVGKDGHIKVFDPYSGIGGAITWLSAQSGVDTADFCMELESQLGGGRASMPSPDWIRAHGGLTAHLEVTMFKSGLLAAKVHSEDHNLLFYNGRITECRGMKDRMAEIDVPFQLQGLMIEGFDIKVMPQEIDTGSDKLCGYVTTGKKVSPFKGHGLVAGAEATLTYGVLRLTAPNFVTEYPPKLIVAEVGVNDGASKFGISLTADPEAKYQFTYGKTPEPVHEFNVDRSGKLGGVVLVVTRGGQQEKLSVKSEQWASAFNACFGTRFKESVPSIDIEASLLKMVQPFTHHSLPLPESAAASQGTQGKSALEQFIVYVRAQ
ncbi:MAG: hypothetical protein AABX69_00460 [Nanoarchaeota archaeon]